MRPYLYYDIAISICSTCYRKVEGKIVFEGGNVYLLKRCPEHGAERVLVADDVDYYRRSREVFIKPPEMPYRYNTPVKWGCPYDCGLCTDHEQHSCLPAIIFYWRDGRRGVVKGLIIAAAITFLLNATCAALVFGSMSFY